MKMQTCMKRLAAVLVAVVSVTAFAANLNVPTTGQTISTSPGETYANVTVDGNLTVTGPGTVLKNSGTITIGENADAPVTVKVENGARWQPSAESKSVVFKGKGGTLDISSPAEFKTGWNGLGVFGNYSTLSLSSDATSETGICDLARLGQNGVLGALSIVNNNPSVVARVLFDGGFVYCANKPSNKFAPAACELRLEGVNGNPVRLDCLASASCVFGGAGTIVVTGACDVVLNPVNDANPAPEAQLFYQYNPKPTVRWCQTGDLRLGQRGTIHVSNPNMLPYGNKTGIVRLEGTDKANPLVLNLGGWSELTLGALTHRVNSIVANANSVLTNIQAQAATIIFGTEDVAGTLQAPRMGGKFAVQKIGAGTLAITNTPGPFVSVKVDGGRAEIRKNAATTFEAGAVTVAEGATFAVFADTTANSLTAGSGASIVVDGCTLVLADGQYPAAATVTCLNGGSIICRRDVATAERYDARAAGGASIEKAGDGVLAVVTAADASLGDVTVGAGTVRLGALGTDNRFWRWTFTEGLKTTEFLVGPCRLYNASNGYADGGATDSTPNYSQQSYSTAASTLSAKQFTVKSGAGGQAYCVAASLNKKSTPPYNPVGDGATKVPGVFFTQHNASMCAFTNPVPVKANSDTYIIYTYRTPDTCGYPCGYDLRAQYDGATYMEKSWKIESSPTGEDGTWELMDEQVNQSSSGANWYHGKAGGNTSTSPYQFPTALHAGEGLTINGTVAVAKGATLDCSLVEGGQEISSLTVDLTAEGGTLKGVKFAQTGVLYLTNAPTDKFVGVVPLTLDGCVAAGGLEWRVFVNGKQRTSRLTFDGNVLKVIPNGMCIIVK